MNPENYTPEIRELVAKNILLSKGGCLYPGCEDLAFNVITKDSTTVRSKVSSIHFTPGWPDPWYLCFLNGLEALVKDPEDLLKVWDFIITNYAFPDRNILIEKEPLLERLKLRERNIVFITRHGDIDEEDIRMIEGYRRVIEAKRKAVQSNPIPMVGDTVEGAYYDGAHPFRDGVIDTMNHWDKELSVCARPYVPFVHYRGHEGEDIGLSVSGGPFFGIDAKDLEYIGPDTRWFCDWGHAGICAQGSIDFPVTVNRWRVKPNVKI